MRLSLVEPVASDGAGAEESVLVESRTVDGAGAVESVELVESCVAAGGAGACGGVGAYGDVTVVTGHGWGGGNRVGISTHSP